ncbi:hypothetical protein BOTBODRAFT_53696 [Botryobasidium botryosum FD-172 SS1]|uniref:CBM1 domain-containing protein n=1 Tax=Botryobasidium botryosum (strain FD-172 SS1) TaxID=930990 RepID=A0A067N001_BOTB1|nr:hypothetical protein BOTBODRAFT_53696 [Botryobasidium botryosum FD-172 SS1]
MHFARLIALAIAVCAGLVVAVPTELVARNQAIVCGGLLGTKCPPGYTCQIDDEGGSLDDAQGICVPNY